MRNDPGKEYVLPATEAESARLERQAGLYGGTQFLEPFLADSPGRVLDVGCGIGFFTRHVADRLPGGVAIGIDASEQRLARARSRAGAPNLRFQRGDLEALPFGDDEFDLAFCRFVLVHAPDPEAALAEMVRVVRPGGKIVAYEAIHDGIWFAPDKPAFARALRETMRVMHERGMEPSLGLHLGPAMVRVGLEDISVRPICHTCLGQDTLFGDYRRNWIDTVSGLGELLGGRLDRAVLDRALEELADTRPDQLLVELTMLTQGRKPHA